MSAAADPFASIAQPAPAQTGADPFAAITQPAQASTPASFRPKDEQGLPIMSSHFEAAKYSLGEAAKGVGDVVGGAVEAFDPRRKEGENAFTQLPFVRMAKSAIEPLTHIGEIPGAIKDIADSPSPLHALATVAPRAAGQGIGTYLTGKATEAGVKGLSKVGQLRTGGVQPFVRKFTQVESALKDEVGLAAEKQGVALEKNKADRLETFKENMRKQSEANFDIGREKIAVAEKNRGIEAENKAAESEVAKRKVAEQLVDQASEVLGEKLNEVEDSVHKAADAKFDAVRSKIGNPETEPAPLIDAVKSAEENILQGIPENIKEFRSILGHGEEAPAGLEDAFREATGEEPQGPLPITWDKLQSLKSRINARLRMRGRMNGDVKRALYSVQDTIVNTMGDIAEQHGADALWEDARNAWREYKEDFHEGTGANGSPVAKAREAVDPANIRGPFLGKARSTLKNRGVEILRKYPQHGGNEAATLAEQMVNVHDTMTSLPKKATAKPLKEPKQVHDMPARKPAPPVPETPVIDARQVARDAIAKKAANWGSFNARDIGVLSSSFIGGPILWMLGERSLGGALIGAGMYEAGKYGASRALNSPKIIEWLAKTPPEEAAALAKIPGADKVKIVDGLTQIATQTGKPVQLSGPAKQLLGPANVAKIMAAGGAAGATQVKNRKDALDLLNTQPTQ